MIKPLNSNILFRVETFNQPIETDYPSFQYKKINYKKVKDVLNKYCSNIFNCMMDNLVEKKKYQYIDIKVHDLKFGDNTANGLWHLDCSLNPGIYYENYLFVTGVNNTTEFVTNSFNIPMCKNKFEFSKCIDIQNNKKIVRLTPCTITRYYGDNVHRGVECKIPEKRLLLRLVNTDVIMDGYTIKG